MAKYILFLFVSILLFSINSISNTLIPRTQTQSNQACRINDPRPICNPNQIKSIESQKADSYRSCVSAGNNPDECRKFVFGNTNPKSNIDESRFNTNGSPLQDYDSGSTPPSLKSPSFSQCESAYKKTQVTCNGQTIAPAVTALLNSVAQMKSSGNMKAACESAKKVSA